MTQTPERPRREKGEPIASWNARREAYVATHRDIRSGNREMLRRLDDAVGWLMEPGEFEPEPAPAIATPEPAPPPPSPAAPLIQGVDILPEDLNLNWPEGGAGDGSDEGSSGDDGAPEEEPLPDALARLVPDGIEHLRRIQYLRERWQSLTHKLMSPHTFGEMSEAERIEHQELERYRGLFT